MDPRVILLAKKFPLPDDMIREISIFVKYAEMNNYSEEFRIPLRNAVDLWNKSIIIDSFHQEVDSVRKNGSTAFIGLVKDYIDNETIIFYAFKYIDIGIKKIDVGRKGKKYELYFANKLRLDRGIKEATRWYRSGDYLDNRFYVNKNFSKYIKENDIWRIRTLVGSINGLIGNSKMENINECRKLKAMIISLIEDVELPILKELHNVFATIINRKSQGLEFVDYDL